MGDKRGKLPHEAQETAVRAIDELITMEKRMDDLLAPLNLGGVVIEERQKLADGIQRVRGVVYDEFEALKWQEPPMVSEAGGGDALRRTPSLTLTQSVNTQTEENVLKLLQQLNTVTEVVNACAERLLMAERLIAAGTAQGAKDVRELREKLELRELVDTEQGKALVNHTDDIDHLKRDVRRFLDLATDLATVQQPAVEPTAEPAGPKPATLRLIEQEIRHLQENLLARSPTDPQRNMISRELVDLEAAWRTLTREPVPQVDDERREGTVRPR